MHLSIIIIIIAASLFRLTNLDIIEFKADEATNLFLASRPAFGLPLLPGGIATSVGILNPPFFIYILVPFVSISQDPRFATFFIAIANVIAIVGFYYVLKKYYNQALAFTTSILLAFSPWSILLSRKIWPPDVVLPFVVFLIYCLHKIIIEKKTVFWIGVITTISFIAQLDIAYVIFGVVLLVTLFLTKPKFSIKYILIGFILGIIPLIPYLTYQIQTGCLDCTLFLDLRQKLSTVHNVEIFKKPFQLVALGGFRDVLGDDTLTFSKRFLFVYSLRTLLYIEYPLLALGMVIFWRRYPSLRFLVHTAILTPLVYFILKLEPATHYFVVLMPFLFIFLATAFAVFLKTKTKLIKYTTFFLLVIIIIVSFFFNQALFSLIESQKGLKGDYGSSFIHSFEDKHEYFKRYNKRDDYNLIVISSYIPTYVMYGDRSFTQMLYPYKEVEKELENLERQIKKPPTDPRILHRLVGYYTTSPTLDTIRELKNKTSETPSYKSLYQEVLNFYQHKNLKKVYVQNLFPFIFEYPQHWKLEKLPEERGVKIGDENYVMRIQKVDEQIMLSNPEYRCTPSNYFLLNQMVQKRTCITKDNQWENTTFSPIILENDLYQIIFSTRKEKRVSYDKAISTLSVMEDVVRSIRQ